MLAVWLLTDYPWPVDKVKTTLVHTGQQLLTAQHFCPSTQVPSSQAAQRTARQSVGSKRFGGQDLVEDGAFTEDLQFKPHPPEQHFWLLGQCTSL
ncbi:hypothetical protein RvY_11620 [Ramazzottius varieornatus]|uniref:Uncharacterized protein n=1 Tax=Ramazzottius varieornatus TaxID=947166 RepID=A0A1D1VJ51_RAMVA|nr:hypothetical protein RvY_11620 [Ramazzottius varieornatus]